MPSLLSFSKLKHSTSTLVGNEYLDKNTDVDDVKRKSTLSLNKKLKNSIFKKPFFLLGNSSKSKICDQMSEDLFFSKTRYGFDPIDEQEITLSRDSDDKQSHIVDSVKSNELEPEYPRLGGNYYFIKDREALASYDYDYYSKHHMEALNNSSYQSIIDAEIVDDFDTNSADTSELFEKYPSTLPPTEIVDAQWDGLMVWLIAVDF